MRQVKNRWWIGAWYRPRRDIPADREHDREMAVRDLTDKDGNRWQLVPRRDPAELERGVHLVDRQGDPRGDVEYWVTLDRSGPRPVITSLSIEVPTGSKIDKRFLDRMPLPLITDAAATYLNESDQLGPGEMIIVPEEGDPSIHVHGTMPDLEELADLYWGEGRSGVVDRYTKEYGVKPATVDRWIRIARNTAGPDGKPLIDPPATGRPKKAKTASKTASKTTRRGEE